MTIPSVSFALSKGQEIDLKPNQLKHSALQAKTGNAAEQAVKNLSKKRKRDDESEEVEKLEEDKVKYTKILKELEPPIEMQSHDAFLLGFHQHREEKILRINEDGIKNLEDCAFVLNESVKLESKFTLKRKNQKLVDDIAKNRSKIAAKQLKVLFCLLDHLHYTNRQNGKLLLDFAIQLIQTIPSSAVEASDEFAEKLSNELQESDAEEFEKSLEEHLEDEPLVDEYPEITQTLGELFLLIDTDIEKAVQSISKKSLEQNCRKITKEATQVINEAAEKVLQHGLNHEKYAIQGVDEALFNQMSKEFAKLLLLSSGDINIGIKERICQLVTPEKYAETTSAQDIHNVMTTICNSSEILNSIKKCNPPATPNASSDLAIRVYLNIPYSEPITQRDAQVFLVSSLLSHIRQAMAGTCFATCFLIKAWNEQLDLVTTDLVECVEFGEVSRNTNHEMQKFPFQTRLTGEYLDVLITANKNNGEILSTERYTVRANSINDWPNVAPHSLLYQSPSFRSVFMSMNIENPEAATISALQNLPEKFSAIQLIKELANVAVEGQKNRLSLRSQPILTKDELVIRGLYAYGSQTNHPLVRGYEQTTTIMMDYFSEPETWPQWINNTMREVLKTSTKGSSPEYQAMYHQMLKTSFLPMIMRMKYLYNPYFDDNKVLFNDGNHGIYENSWYGFELWDMGLPKDFEYSNKLFEQIQKEASWVSIYRFNEYAPKHTWKRIDTPEKFQGFLKEVINQTANHLISTLPSKKKNLVDLVASRICYKIDKPNFVSQMVSQLFGPKYNQKKKWIKNKFTMHSTPWKFKWGGWPEEVLKTFYGFRKCPVKMKEFNGTQKEVLAKCINYIKNQPTAILEDIKELYSRIMICSPVHAFLLTPGEESFSNAIYSEQPTLEYIEQNVIEPGLRVSNGRLSTKARNEIVEYVASNQWYHRNGEADDFERIQLTEASQKVFDDSIGNTEELMKTSIHDFQKEVCKLVYTSRAADPNIGERNSYWEKQFALIFNHKLKSLIQDVDDSEKIPEDIAESMLDFARNHRDTNKFSPEDIEKFRTAAADIPKRLSVQAFREEVVNIAYKIHCDSKGRDDKSWKKSFAVLVDTKLFKFLPKKDQEAIINTGIVTHDSNWKVTVYDCHLMFTVNPGSGKLELCKYEPDLNSLSFMGQSEWFPSGKNHGSWQFPDNYRVFQGRPLFNMNKLLWK